MPRIVIVISLILLSLKVQAQKVVLDTFRKKVVDFTELESKCGGTLTANKTTYGSRKALAQPLVYRHEEKEIADLLTYYFYYEEDSTVDYVLYEWDEANFHTGEEIAAMKDVNVSAYIETYNRLLEQVSAQYGVSKSEGDLTDIAKIETGKLRRDDVWQLEGGREIELYCVLSAKYEKKGIITTLPTYRIRLYVRNNVNKR